MAHIDTSEVIRAGIWIRPAGDALEQLQKAVRLAHKEAGGPPIHPHITLLSGAETTRAAAEVKLKHLAQRMRPFTITLGPLDWRDDYFRSFYATVELTNELAQAQRDAYDAFDMKPAPPYEPHLSLAYGKIEESVKKRIAAQLGNRIEVQFEVRALDLVNATSTVPVADWHTLIELPLAA